MKPCEILAISKAFKEKEISAARDDLQQGSIIKIDFSANFSGNLTVGLPAAASQDTRNLCQEALLLALRKPGPHQSMLADCLGEAVQKLSTEGLGRLEAPQEIVAMAGLLPEIKRRPSISFLGLVSPISPPRPRKR